MPFQKSNPSLYGWSQGRIRVVSHSKNDVKQLICVKLALAVLPGPVRPSGICWVNAGCASSWPESWGVFCTPKLLYSCHHSKNMQRKLWLSHNMSTTSSSSSLQIFSMNYFKQRLLPLSQEQQSWGNGDRTTNGSVAHESLINSLLIGNSVFFLIPLRIRTGIVWTVVRVGFTDLCCWTCLFSFLHSSSWHKKTEDYSIHSKKNFFAGSFLKLMELIHIFCFSCHVKYMEPSGPFKEDFFPSPTWTLLGVF